MKAVLKARFGFIASSRRREVFARETREAFEQLGPAFVKTGQLISVRPDIFAPETVFEMERLQDSLEPVPAERVRSIIEAEFGRRTEDLFDDFDDEPIASASIAQVHKARLAESYRPVVGEVLPEGHPVAVKVVRPGAAEAIEADLEVARLWLARLSRISSVRRYNPEGLLREFETSLHSELDMRNEARVADRFAFDFRGEEVAFVPRVVWPRTSHRVLTTEFVEGWRLSELDEAASAGVDGYALAMHGAELFMQQVLVFGRYHADLHPANLLVTPDGRICYLDFGIVGHTDPQERAAIAQVLAATVYGDAERAIRYSAELGLEIPASEVEVVRGEVAELMMRTMRPGRPSDVKGFALGFLGILRRHRIEVPLGYGMLIKALATVEGVAKALYPEIDIVKVAAPFTTRLVAREMLRPERIAERGPEALRAAMRVLLG